MVKKILLIAGGAVLLLWIVFMARHFPAMKAYDEVRDTLETPVFSTHQIDEPAGTFLETVKNSWTLQSRESPDPVFAEVSSTTGVENSVAGVVSFHTHEIPGYSFFDHRRNASEGVMATAMAVALPESLDNRIYAGEGLAFVKLTEKAVELFEDTDDGLRRSLYLKPADDEAGTGQTAAATEPDPDDYANKDPKDLGHPPVEPIKDPKTGFVVGGTNATELIRGLTEINGIPIAELEESMRPDELSRAGFLGRDESLLEVMAADNDWVLQSGLTHQELARHLLILASIGRRESEAFTYHGVRFTADVIVTDGFQDSPFEDGTRTNVDVVLQNLDNGEAMKFSPLVPLMVERYGFYEGKGTTFRVDPRTIVKVLTFLRVKQEKQ